MNVYMLVHVADVVNNWGPLWAYSCFQFESMNKELKKLFRGTRNMSKQVIFFNKLNLQTFIYSNISADGILIYYAAVTAICSIANANCLPDAVYW